MFVGLVKSQKSCHCKRSEAISAYRQGVKILSPCENTDCHVAPLLAMKSAGTFYESIHVWFALCIRLRRIFLDFRLFYQFNHFLFVSFNLILRRQVFGKLDHVRMLQKFPHA